MTTAVNDVVDQVELLLKDSSNTRWSAAFHISSLNEGSSQIVQAKPDVGSTKTAMALSSGVWQDLPSGGIQLLDVVANMGTNGSTRGDTVTMVEKAVMDRVDPSWMTATASTTVEHVVYDHKRWPKKFMVYPQSTGTNYLEIFYAKIPTTVSAGENIAIGDEWATALYEFMLFRAYSLDFEIPGAAERAMQHVRVFAELIGRRDMAEAMVGPIKKREDS